MAAKPRLAATDEADLMTRLWSPQLADDPEKFVLFAFPWGVKGTPLETFAGPRPWQRLVLRAIGLYIRHARTRLLLGLALEAMMKLARRSGRGIGKSALVCWLILWFLTTRIGGTVIVSANTEHQLRSVTWGELAKWVALSINAHWWDVSATKLAPHDWLAQMVETQLQKGTRQWAAEGKLWSEEKPDAYAGPHNMQGMMVIFDEASGIPDSIWTVANGYFTEPIVDRYWFAFSQGRRNEGYFHEVVEGTKQEFWDADSIDAREVEGTDLTLYEQIVKEYGEDSDEARVEVYGQAPGRGSDQFFSPAALAAAMKRPLYNDPTAPTLMGVDPSRGGDTTVILVRRGRDIVQKIRFKESDLMVVVGRIIAAMQEWNPQLVCVDEGGLGAGVVDRLNEQNYGVRGVNFGWKSVKPRIYGNKRAEMYGAAREWIKTAAMGNDDKLKKDLLAIKQKIVGSKGQIWLQTKEEMGFSPDDADALVLTFAFPVGDLTTEQRIDTPSVGHYAQGHSDASWMAH